MCGFIVFIKADNCNYQPKITYFFVLYFVSYLLKGLNMYAVNLPKVSFNQLNSVKNVDVVVIPLPTNT